ncbi:MAG: serine/threonine-protein kinase [Myxococcota bacterium]
MDRYAIDDFLGIGAAGSVWRAQPDGQARPVALKILAASVDAEAQRFERGARLVEGLEHPHIARTLTHGRTDGEDGEVLLYVVMELLEGETLAAAQSRVKRFAVPEAARIADEVLSALEHAHARNIVHRDLKTSNLFLGPDGHVKLLDFGIAKIAGGERVAGPFFPDDAVIGDEVTGQHKICGTPEYMAPEQIVGAPADVRSDLYGVGIVLYKMLSGIVPFRARARFELYHRTCAPRRRAAPEEAEVPPALAAVVERALAKKPEDRFQSAREMRDALRAAVGKAPIADAGSLFPRTRPGEARPPSAPHATAAARAGLLPAVDLTPAPLPRRRTRGQRVAVAFFLVSVVVLASVVATKLVDAAGNPEPTASAPVAAEPCVTP